MSLADDVSSDLQSLHDDWIHKKIDLESKDVPDPSAMGYSDSYLLPATYLYTDMIDSSTLAAVARKEETASVITTFLKMSVRIMRGSTGHIRSFDGDRVMAIFAGPDRQSRAVRAALRIRHSIDVDLNNEVQAAFPSIKKSGWSLKSMSGIATGEALLVRAGIRNNSDLVSIGLAPNLAAKLSDLREGSTARIAIGAGTYKQLNKNELETDGVDMWKGPKEIPVGGKNYPFYTCSWKSPL